MSSGRDYKNNKRPVESPPSALGGFIGGLTIGLSIAVAVYVHDRLSLEPAASKPPAAERTSPARAPAANPPARKPSAPVTAASGQPAAPPADPEFDFYEMLPKFEVVVPEQDETAPAQSRRPLQKPGVYMLQAGSFRNSEDAERVRALIALQGVQSKVQRVAIDRDTWHRVRIGPISNLAQLEATRSKLRQAQIEALVIRIGG